MVNMLFLTVRAEIMVDSLNENIIAVPLGTDLTDFAKKSKSPQHSEDGPEVLRILETSGQTPKRPKNSPVLMVRTVQTQPAQSNAIVTKFSTPPGHTRQKQVTLDTTSKSLLHSEVSARSQSKTNTVNKILIATDSHQRSHHDGLLPSTKVDVPAVEVKSQLSGFSEENLPAFTSAIDKTASQGLVLHSVFCCLTMYLLLKVDGSFVIFSNESRFPVLISWKTRDLCLLLVMLD